MTFPTLSVVVPTLSRPTFVDGLLDNLALQSSAPDEIIIVDGADDADRRTEEVVRRRQTSAAPHELIYLRSEPGTARQRNRGVEESSGRLVAFIDDDIRLEPDFFAVCVQVLDSEPGSGAVCGLIVDQLIDRDTSAHWRWMRRLHCFGRFEPGWFDETSGHPIPRYLGGLHEEMREIEVMGAGCSVWRRSAFSEVLGFDTWFTGYGMLEDVHLSMRAARKWKLLELGTARCSHLRADEARPDQRELSFRSVVSYRYLFEEMVAEPTWGQRARWWYVQLVDLVRLIFAVPAGGEAERRAVRGKASGILAVLRRQAPVGRARGGS